jgi:pimeloyl-ACP methyl ester carboxylesterase
MLPCHPGTETLDIPPPLAVEDALARFHREGTRAVVNMGRYRCSYYTWGTGPALLFLHGLSDVASSFVPLIAHLSAHFRCIAYDLPTGQGDGARLRTYRHVDLVTDALALLDHLSVDRCHAFGNSFGSTVLLAAAHARTERFDRLIVQGAFARRCLAPAEILLARLARSCWLPVRALPLRQTILRHNARGTFAAQPPAHWRFFLEATGTNPVAAMAQRALLLHNLDLRPLLATIRQPVLLIRGDEDTVVRRECADELSAGLPNVTRIELSGCGHYAPFTHPEVLAAVIRSFLTPPPCHD